MLEPIEGKYFLQYKSIPGRAFAELLNCILPDLKTHSLHFLSPCGIHIKIYLLHRDTANTRIP